jgi:hypothetical protein
MYARVTPFELDTLRMPLRDAVARFQELVLPEIRRQPGYAGMQVMSTSEGRGMLVTLWDTEEAAAAGIASGFYDEQVAKFLMLLREPPGRDHYAVLLTDAPALAPA